jgi:hypothetical protein
MRTEGKAMAERRFENEQTERLYQSILRSVRRRLAETGAETPLNDSLAAELCAPLPKLRPQELPTTDELVVEMLAERDQARAAAVAARGEAEKLRLDLGERLRRRAGRVLLQ